LCGGGKGKQGKRSPPGGCLPGIYVGKLKEKGGASFFARHNPFHSGQNKVKKKTLGPRGEKTRGCVKGLLKGSP